MTPINIVTRKRKFADSNLGNSSELEIESVRGIDHDDPEDRRWLGKHVHWAMREGRSVTSYPVGTPS